MIGKKRVKNTQSNMYPISGNATGMNSCNFESVLILYHDFGMSTLHKHLSRCFGTKNKNIEGCKTAFPIFPKNVQEAENKIAGSKKS